MVPPFSGTCATRAHPLGIRPNAARPILWRVCVLAASVRVLAASRAHSAPWRRLRTRRAPSSRPRGRPSSHQPKRYLRGKVKGRGAVISAPENSWCWGCSLMVLLGGLRSGRTAKAAQLRCYCWSSAKEEALLGYGPPVLRAGGRKTRGKACRRCARRASTGAATSWAQRGGPQAKTFLLRKGFGCDAGHDACPACRCEVAVRIAQSVVGPCGRSLTPAWRSAPANTGGRTYRGGGTRTPAYRQ